MPNIQSAKKKMKQDVKRTNVKDTYRKKISDMLDAAKKGAKSKKKEEIVTKAYSVIDKAAKKEVIPENKADRLKSRVSRLVSK